MQIGCFIPCHVIITPLFSSLKFCSGLQNKECLMWYEEEELLMGKSCHGLLRLWLFVTGFFPSFLKW